MSANISEETIERIRSSNDIVHIVSQYLDLKRTGSNYVGLCPFHSEKTPSFTITPSKQFYHCFGCGENGDIISFIMKMENLAFPEAVKLLGDMAGITIEEKSVDVKKQKEKQKFYNLNREVAIFYFKNLQQDKLAQKYLADRSIGKSTIRNFGLGYALNQWNSLENYLLSKGYEETDIEKAGLISKRKKGNGYYDKFRDRIMFPIFDTKNRIIGFGGRVINDSKPKYINSPDTLIFIKGNNLYGLNLANKYSKRERVVLVEGYTDVISLFNNGIRYGVASLGTALTKNQARLLRRYGDNIYICYDSDEAGLKAAFKAINIFKEININAKIILLPKGEDPDEYINKYGKDKFEELIDKALNYIDYTIFLNKRKYNLDIVEEKIMFTKNIAKVLKKVKSPIELDAYVDKVSMDTGIAKEAIKNEVYGRNINIQKKPQNKYSKSNYRNTKKEINPVESVLEAAHLNAEKSLIKLIIENKDIYNKVNVLIKPKDFMNLECREIGNLVYDLYEEENIIEKDYLVENLKGTKGIDIDNVIEILNMDIIIPNDSVNKLIEDLIDTINYSKLKIQRKNIMKKIHDIDNKKEKDEGDVKILKELSLKLLKIDRELKLHS